VSTLVSKINDELMGTSGAVGILGCDSRTIYRHVAAGRLRCVRDITGRRIFKRSDLEAYKRKHKKIGNRFVITSAERRVN
jgi:excisionase family DNA binding protein